MILAASPNTIRSLARKAGLRSADVYIEDISREGTRATEVYLRSPTAIDWLCDIRYRFPRLSQCQACGHLEAPDSLERWCVACGLQRRGEGAKALSTALTLSDVIRPASRIQHIGP